MRILGPVMQNAFVVPDLQQALDHWTRVMGVGPFYLFEKIEFAELIFRGRPAHNIDITVAIGYWGDLQIELIQQHNDAPSIYTEFPARTTGGLQHMGVISESVARDLAALSARGIEPIQHGVTTAGLRFAYVSTDFHPGGMIELIEANPQALRFFEKMRSTAVDWDGKDPVRPLG